ncbi:MAG: N-methyl-L-tryptophan oxidase [Actinobacteria bacterium]|nr:N-methyl-L-tryptophan oxidase [Actinomycetota bacterium]
MGSAATYHLARRGQKVLGLDRFGQPHVHGSSHGRSRIIRRAYFEGPSYVPIVVRAYELWRELERRSGSPLVTITGGLLIGRADSDRVEAARMSAETHGVDHQVLDAEDATRRFPQLRIVPDELALYEAQAGVLVPELCVAAHLQLADRNGAVLRTGEPVSGWRPHPEGLVVTTASGSYHARNVVLTAGPWIPQLTGGRLPMTVERQYVAWLRPRGDRHLFSGGRLPVFIIDREDDVALYGLPDLHGDGVKVAFHHGGETGDPDALSREVHDDELQRLAGAARDRVPALGDVADAQVCLYTNTHDRHFAIGPHPDVDGLIVAGGFSGHGFKFASAVGEILADLVVDGETGFDLDHFRPGRLIDAPR